ncbi:MAG: hypothetical protein SV201_15220 [Pseudomonadota bacterium]|nr:hypothetical protein [Pseudomonadota bacterium]
MTRLVLIALLALGACASASDLPTAAEVEHTVATEPLFDPTDPGHWMGAAVMAGSFVTW